jgi:hypothetical protein
MDMLRSGQGARGSSRTQGIDKFIQIVSALVPVSLKAQKSKLICDGLALHGRLVSDLTDSPNALRKSKAWLMYLTS